MMWCGMIWYDVIYDVIWYDMIWCDVMWYDMIWCDMIWHDVMWCDVIWYDMIRRDAIWYMMWCGMILYTIWYMIRYDIIYLLNYSCVATRWQQYSTHLHTDSTQNNTKHTIYTTQFLLFWKSAGRARLCQLYPGIGITTEEKARKTLIPGSRRVPVGTMKIHMLPRFTSLVFVQMLKSFKKCAP